MAIHEIRVIPALEDPHGEAVRREIDHTMPVEGLQSVGSAKVYRLEGVTEEEARAFGTQVLADPVTEMAVIDLPPDEASKTFRVGYRRGVMDPAAASVMEAARDNGLLPTAASVSHQYTFFGSLGRGAAQEVADKLLINTAVQEYVAETPETLLFGGEVGPVNTVAVRKASAEELRELSKDKLFLNDDEMRVIQQHFNTLGRDPTDAELEVIAARWSEHCGHKTFAANVIVDGVQKAPLITRIKEASRRHFKDGFVVSAFEDNSGVIQGYDGMAFCAKVETHNSPSALDPYGGSETGSGGVFRDVVGTGKGARTILSTNMYCLAPPDLQEKLPPGTLDPVYMQRGVVAGVRDYGNRMGIPTVNANPLYFHADFRAKPSVIVGGYGVLPEAGAQKGEPQIGDLVVAVGGRTGRDGIHGATFSSGEMTDRTVEVNSTAVQIGNAIEEKRTFDALWEASQAGHIRAMTDCGAAGFSSAIGELGEDVGVTVDLSKAPLKYEGMAPWEILLSESQERMVVAVSPDNLEEFLKIQAKYNVEAAVLGEFDGSNTFTVNYGEQNVVELDYDFLKNGLPQRVMEAHWEPEDVPEFKPGAPRHAEAWISRLESVLAHGNICSKEPVVRQFDHGVQGGNIIPPFGGPRQHGPNDAAIIRPQLGKPYGMVQSQGLNPLLTRLDPEVGTVWSIAEAASNYVSVGGNIREAAAIGNYIWPFPDKRAMGSLDRSVDAAVEMIDRLELPVISGKDSLSSTYRGADGTVIEIPPVYMMSVFGRIPDVEKTVTTQPQEVGTSTLVLVGAGSEGMGGSTYYDVVGGSSPQLPTVDRDLLPTVLDTMYQAITTSDVLACQSVSKGGVAAAVAKMCFGADCGMDLTPEGVSKENMDTFLFNETPGTFVVEVRDFETAQRMFSGVPLRQLGKTTADDVLRLSYQQTNPQATEDVSELFSVKVGQLMQAWQATTQEVFPL